MDDRFHLFLRFRFQSKSASLFSFVFRVCYFIFGLIKVGSLSFIVSRYGAVSWPVIGSIG